jgi:hypothetical protein
MSSASIIVEKKKDLVATKRKYTTYNEKDKIVDIRIWFRKETPEIIYFDIEDTENAFDKIDRDKLTKERHFIEINLNSNGQKKKKTLLTHMGFYHIITTLFSIENGELAHRYLLFLYKNIEYNKLSISKDDTKSDIKNNKYISKYEEVMSEYESERKRYEDILNKSISEDIAIRLEQENNELQDEIAELTSKIIDMEERLDLYARAIKISSAKKIIVAAKKYRELREKYNIDQDIISSLSMEDEENIINEITALATKNTIPSRKKKYILYRRFLRMDNLTEVEYYEWELVHKSSEPRHLNMTRVGFISLSEDRKNLFTRWCESQPDGLSETDITCFEKQTSQYYGEYDRKTYISDQHIRTTA